MDTINSGSYIAYLVYIAGVRVPCQSINIEINNAASNSLTMSIALPAHELLLDLGRSDRVQVSAFYLDTWKYKDNPTWCLLGEGYISGIQYSNTPSKKEMVITVASNIEVLGSLYLEFLGGGESSSGKIGKPGNAVPNELTFKGKFPGQLFTVGLDNKTQIRAPYELVQNIFLAVTGQYKDKDVVKSADKSDLEAELTRVSSLARLNYASKVSNMTSVEKDLFDADLKSKLEARANTIGTKIDTSSAIVDIQEAVIKAEVTSLLKKKSVNSRTAVSSGFFNRFFSLTRLAKHVIASPVLEGLIDVDKDSKKSDSMPSGVFPILRTSRGTQYLKAIARQSGYKYGDNGSAKTLVSSLFSIFNYDFLEIIAPPAFEADSRGLATGRFNIASKNNVIGSFISKPASCFTVPPACNVIFPSMRISMTTGSDYGSMPTRVYYKKSSQGRKLNLDNKTGDGYAHMDSRVGYPAAIARHSIDASKEVKGELEVLVFPEEYYLGPKAIYTEINPMLQEIDKIEKAGRLVDETAKIAASTVSQFDTGSLRADQANYAKEAFSKAKSKGQNNYDLYLKQAKVDYDTSRAATFTCTVNCVFNPYIVPGFSCIIADQESVGCHLIGTVVSISHGISATSSYTTVSLNAVRRLKSVVEDILLDGGLYDMSPLEPVSEVRAVLQKIEAANLYYGNLLYRDSPEYITNSKKTREFLDKLSDIRNKQVIAQNKLEVLQIKDPDKSKDAIAKLEKEIQEYSEKADILILDNTNSGEPEETRIKAACDYRKLFGLTRRGSESSVLDLNIGKLLKDYTELLTPIEGSSRVELLNEFSKLKLVYKNESARSIANSYELAMDYVSRPVCTMEQYIDFYKQSDTPETNEAIGGRGKGSRIKVNYHDPSSKQGKYYDILREFVGGPGVEPGAKAPSSAAGLSLKFIAEGPNNSAVISTFSSIEPNSRATVSELPDTIKDWQELLLDYIEDIKRSGVLQ